LSDENTPVVGGDRLLSPLQAAREALYETHQRRHRQPEAAEVREMLRQLGAEEISSGKAAEIVLDMIAGAVASRLNMDGVTQTRFGNPDGNCYQAALATALGLELSEVPDYVGGNDLVQWADYCTRLRLWLGKRGTAFYGFGRGKDGQTWADLPEGCLVLLGGKSPRGDFKHIVVAKQEGPHLKWFHDPHPDSTFIETVEWCEILLPARSVLDEALALLEEAGPAWHHTCVEGPCQACYWETRQHAFIKKWRTK